jgi:predicted tellurium resistance membrane protein TerC
VLPVVLLGVVFASVPRLTSLLGATALNGSGWQSLFIVAGIFLSVMLITRIGRRKTKPRISVSLEWFARMRNLSDDDKPMLAELRFPHDRKPRSPDRWDDIYRAIVGRPCPATKDSDPL